MAAEKGTDEVAMVVEMRRDGERRVGGGSGRPICSLV